MLRGFLVIALLCAHPAANDAYLLPAATSGPTGCLRSSRRAPALSMKGTQGLQISRRAAVLFTLLPAYAGVAEAKGDATLAFKTEIAGKDGKPTAAH